MLNRKYGIRENSVEVSGYRKAGRIDISRMYDGIVGNILAELDKPFDYILLDTFEDLEEAKAELEKHQSFKRECSGFTLICEYELISLDWNDEYEEWEEYADPEDSVQMFSGFEECEYFGKEVVEFEDTYNDDGEDIYTMEVWFNVSEDMRFPEDVKLYAETFEKDENKAYSELADEILKQAAELGIPEDSVVFE